MTELTKSLTQLSTALFPNINSASDAVLAHQKELQRIIELKNKFNVPATEDIQLWFELFNAWNELKALELDPEPRNEFGAGFTLNPGGENALDNFSNNSRCRNSVVLVGDQTCSEFSGIL